MRNARISALTSFTITVISLLSAAQPTYADFIPTVMLSGDGSGSFNFNFNTANGTITGSLSISTIVGSSSPTDFAPSNVVLSFSTGPATSGSASTGFAYGTDSPGAFVEVTGLVGGNSEILYRSSLVFPLSFFAYPTSPDVFMSDGGMGIGSTSTDLQLAYANYPGEGVTVSQTFHLRYEETSPGIYAATGVGLELSYLAVTPTVPEPGSCGLLMGGLGIAVVWMRRERSRRDQRRP